MAKCEIDSLDDRDAKIFKESFHAYKAANKTEEEARKLAANDVLIAIEAEYIRLNKALNIKKLPLIDVPELIYDDSDLLRVKKLESLDLSKEHSLVQDTALNVEEDLDTADDDTVVISDYEKAAKEDLIRAYEEAVVVEKDAKESNTLEVEYIDITSFIGYANKFIKAIKKHKDNFKFDGNYTVENIYKNIKKVFVNINRIEPYTLKFSKQEEIDLQDRKFNMIKVFANLGLVSEDAINIRNKIIDDYFENKDLTKTERSIIEFYTKTNSYSPAFQLYLQESNTLMSDIILKLTKASNIPGEDYVNGQIHPSYYLQTRGKKPSSVFGMFANVTNHAKEIGKHLDPDLSPREISRVIKEIKSHSKSIENSMDFDITHQQNFGQNPLLGFLNSEGQLDQNIQDAMGLVRMEFLAKDASGTMYNNDKAINRILGNDDKAPVARAAAGLLRNSGDLASFTAPNMGKKVLGLLNLSAAPDADGNHYRRLEAAIGNVIIKSLLDDNLAESIAIPSQTLNNFRDKPYEVKSGETTNFIRIGSHKDERQFVDIRKRKFDATEGGYVTPESVTNMKEFYGKNEATLKALFGQSYSRNYPTFGKPPKKVNTNYRSSLSKVSPHQIKAAEATQESGWIVDINNLQGLNKLSLENQKLMLGYQDEEDYIKDMEDTVEGINLSVDNALEEFHTFVKDNNDKVSKQEPFFYKYFFTQLGRMQIDNKFNPQENKFVRHLITKPEWNDVEYDKTNDKDMSLYSLAMLEALGAKPQLIDGNLSTEQNVILSFKNHIENNPVFTEASNLLNSDKDLTVEQQNKVIEAIKEGGEKTASFHALMSLYRYNQASEGGKFKTNMTHEVDGVTNGIVTGMTQLVPTLDSAQEFVSKGAINTKTDNESHLEWSQKEGNLDVYVEIGTRIISNRNEAIDNIRKGSLATLDERKLANLKTHLRSIFGNNSASEEFVQDKLLKFNDLNSLVGTKSGILQEGDIPDVIAQAFEERKSNKTIIIPAGYAAGKESLIRNRKNNLKENIVKYVNDNEDISQLAELLNDLFKDELNKKIDAINKKSENPISHIDFHTHLTKENLLNEQVLPDSLPGFDVLFDAVMGEAISEGVDSLLGGMEEQRKYIFNAFNSVTLIAKAVYENKVEELKKELDKTSISDADQKKILLDMQAEGSLPMLKHFSSEDSENFSDFLDIHQMDKTFVPNEEGGTASVKYKNPINNFYHIDDDRDFEKEKNSMNSNIRVNTLSDDVGVKAFLFYIISMDANTAANTLQKFPNGLNIYDAYYASPKFLTEPAKEQNKYFTEIAYNSAVMQSIAESIARALPHYNKLSDKQKADIDGEFQDKKIVQAENKDDTYEDMSHVLTEFMGNLKLNLKQKEEFFKTVKRVEQYSIEAEDIALSGKELEKITSGEHTSKEDEAVHEEIFNFIGSFSKKEITKEVEHKVSVEQQLKELHNKEINSLDLLKAIQGDGKLDTYIKSLLDDNTKVNFKYLSNIDLAQELGIDPKNTPAGAYNSETNTIYLNKFLKGGHTQKTILEHELNHQTLDTKIAAAAESNDPDIRQAFQQMVKIVDVFRTSKLEDLISKDDPNYTIMLQEAKWVRDEAMQELDTKTGKMKVHDPVRLVQEFNASLFSNKEFFRFVDQSQLGHKDKSLLRKFFDAVIGLFPSSNINKKGLIADIEGTMRQIHSVDPKTGYSNNIIYSPQADNSFENIYNNMSDTVSEDMEHIVNDYINPAYEALHKVNPDALYAKNIKESTIREQEVYGSNLGKVHSFTNYNSKETFVYDNTHALLYHGLKGNEQQRRIIANVHRIAKRKLKPSDLIPENHNLTEEQAFEKATMLYKHLFKNDDYETGLIDFTTLGLVDSQFKNIINKFTTKDFKIKEGKTLTEKLENVFSYIIKKLSNFLLNTSNKDLSEALENIALDLVKIKKHYKDTSTLDKINNSAASLLTKTLKPIKEYSEKSTEKLAEEGRKSKVNRDVPDLGRIGKHLLNMPVNMFNPEYRKNLQEFMDNYKQTADSNLGQIFGELSGINKLNEKYIELLAKSKHVVDAGSKDLEGITKSNIEQNMLTKVSKKDWSLLNNAILKTDISSLIKQGLSYDYIKSILNDDKKLHQEIRKYSGQLNQFSKEKTFYKDHAHSLGHFMATGKALLDSHQMNAYNIAHVLAAKDHKPKGDVVKAESIIEILSTLYAVKYTDMSARNKGAEILTNEFKEDKNHNGFINIINTHNYFKEESLHKNFHNNKNLTFKGYTKENTNSQVSFKIGTAAEEKELKKLGYTKVNKNALATSDLDLRTGRGQDMYIYLNKAGKQRPYKSQIVMLKDLQAKGSSPLESLDSLRHDRPSIIEAMQMAGSDVQNYNNRMNRKINEQLLNQKSQLDFKSTHAIPVMSSSNYVKEPVNFRYTMSENNKVNLLGKEDLLNETLGRMMGDVHRKESSRQINIDLMKLVKEDFDKYSGTPGEKFIRVGSYNKTLANDDKKTEQKALDMYRMMPKDMKRDLYAIWGSNEMYIREGLFNLIFGYREVSATEWVDAGIRSISKGKMQMNPVIKDSLLVGGKLWDLTVAQAKQSIVVLGNQVLPANITSNYILSAMRGIPLKYVTKYQLLGVDSLVRYQRDHEEYEKLRQQLQVNSSIPQRKKLERRLSKLKANLEASDVHQLIDMHTFQKIAEDIDPSEDKFSDVIKPLFPKLTNLFDDAADRIPGFVKEAYKQSSMHPDTASHKLLAKATQYSDFIARFAMFKYLTEEKGIGKQSALTEVRETFVVYDKANAPILDWANRKGIFMYTKFLLGIQKVIFKSFKHQPVNNISSYMLQNAIYDMPDIYDSNLISSALRDSPNDFPVGLIQDAFNPLRIFEWIPNIFR